MYSNCFIIALLKKLKSPSNKIYIIKPKSNSHGDFHIMWKDKNNKVFHFTRDKGYDVKW